MPLFLRVILIFAIPAVVFFIMFTNPTGNAQNLGLSDEDYANGSKRSSAAFKKVTPSLKEAFSEKNLRWKSPIFIRAFKQERILELWVKNGGKFTLFKSYPILAASGTLGPKQEEGDLQVPEGFYFVSPAQMNPQSLFHLSFNVGYPNSFDRAHNRDGTAIMVHGSNVSIGCLAMGDDMIEEIYTLAHAAFEGGQKFFRVHLFPFHLTDDKLAKHPDSQWLPFWKNLRTGYQWFEDKKLPPNVSVKEKRYHFE